MTIDMGALFSERQATPLERFDRVWKVLEHFWEEAPSGFSDAELAGLEDRIGLRLPAALREGLAQFGTSAGMNAQDRFFDLSEVSRANGYITFRVENQGVSVWAVRDEPIQDDPPTDDPPTDDPRVWVSYSPAFDEWFDTHNTVSEFFENVVLFEATLADVWSAYADIDQDIQAMLEQAGYTLLNTARFDLPNSGEQEERFCGGVDVLIADFASTSIYIAALTEHALQQVLTQVPLNWTVSSR
jgi:hypothetical protein